MWIENNSLDKEEWWFYSTPEAWFNDLIDQIDDKNKYLIYFLRQYS